MITKKMEDALNDQINKELYSSYLYLAMSAYFEAGDLVGFASWMRVQAQEELVHVMKFYDYIQERDGRPVLTQIAAPPKEWKSPSAAFEEAYKHEQLVSASINELVNVAETEKDKASFAFLQWFVNEQVEEEASALAIVKKLRLAGDSRSALFMMDTELSQRTFVPPAAPAE
jgi:ferritin